jgi:mannose-6-phosphate isomerase class I
MRVCAKSGKRKVIKMKKKKIEQIAAERLARIEDLECLLGRRRQEIMQLKGEVQGLRELNGILEAMILQLVEDKGKVVISRAKLREGIGQSFSIKATDEEFILSAERSEDIEQV